MRAWLLVLVCVGCATGYHSSGFSGGFSEMRLNDRAYEVSFQGNGYTRAEVAQRYAMRRAADLTLAAGYTHFVVDGQDSSTHVSSRSRANGSIVVTSRPLASLRFRMLSAQESAEVPPGLAYDAKMIMAQGS